MKGVELSYNQQRGVAFPFGFSGKAECVNESPGVRGAAAGGGGRGGGGGGGAGENPTSSWFGSISGHPVRGLLYENCPSLQPSYSGFHNNNSIPHTTPNTSWIQQVQGTLPLEGYNWSGSSDTKDLVMRYPPCSALNAGSLVLDSSRGELVNALKMTPKEILEAKALAASKSHSEAERRRRERINSHLATLRTILPSSLKTDKASLLAEVIDQVKRLKRQVSDVYQYGSMPTESDELNVEKDPESGKGRIVIRASMCCDDRLDLMTDLKHTLDTLKLQTVKAEISTLGGRIKNVFVVTLKDDTAEQDLDMLIKQVQEALRLVMERPGRGELLQGKFSKRQRLTSFEAQVDS